MYSLDKPVSQLRTKMRTEFERHRYVGQLQVVDMLLQHSNSEYQVRMIAVGVLSVVQAQEIGYDGCGVERLRICFMPGNFELLEAITTRSQIF